MTHELKAPEKYVLGLDLGSASLGWALIGLNSTGDPERLIRAGVRIFEPGVDGSSLEIDQGKDQSKAVERRAARLQRRQLRRRVARQRELFLELQRVGLLPANATGKGAGSEQRHQLLNAFDQALTAKYLSSDGETFAQGPLYFLRKRALDHALEAHELGRVFFHLSQRRGFKSNRKETKRAKDNDDPGQVKEEIHSLELAMKEAGARTLGEYFAGLDPHLEKIRRRWTARRMFEEEFALIWSSQQPYHAEILTQKLHDELWELLFFQRPISAQKHLVGTCELERGDKKHPPKRRAPWASLAAQRFRMLQKINDLVVLNASDRTSRRLTAEERKSLYELLDREGTHSFAAIRKHLGLKGTTFNLEAGGDKDLPGNRTQKSMRKAFGDAWDNFSEGKQNQIVENWRNSESDEILTQEAIAHLGLDQASAAILVNEKPQADYCALSLVAIGKLMPLMFDGKSFKEAETEIYGSRFSGLPVLDSLPPVREALPTLRNPAVERALTELRKVVNAIVRAYGKPYEIRIELARELKKPRQERVKATVANRKREAENKALAKRMADGCGIQNPSRKDLEKAKLWVEQMGECPYSGKRLAFSRLFDDPEFDVDHILPISRHPDDSYQNKVLCCLDENRTRKRNQTPYEAYSSDAEEWRIMLARVAKWNNPGKLRKFELATAEELAEFSSRQLNDTRYTSVKAGQMLSLLFGGRNVVVGDERRQAVFASTGAVTATLRRNWGFERILQGLVTPEAGESRGKPRTDHRHHAIDAITIALTRQSVIQSMANEAQFAPWQHGTRAWARVPKPWTSPEFEHEIKRQIAEMVVSHRPEHKISGELHKGSNYGKPYMLNGKSTIHSRCAISSLSVADIEAEDVIVDPAVRDAVRAKLQEIGGNPKLFDKLENTPYLISATGRNIPIRKARVRETKNPMLVGKGVRERYVASGGIHHVELFVIRDASRKESWDSKVVQRTEAYERQRRKQPVVGRVLDELAEAEFLFSLSNDDTIEINEGEQRRIVRIKKSGENKQIFYVPVNDAHLDSEQSKFGIVKSKTPNTLRPLAPRKVVVDLLGKVHSAND
jgi:CRISPR-associated endonuclease Csn1